MDRDQARDAVEHHIVTLRGSMTEIVTMLATSVAAGRVVSIQSTTPCSGLHYETCPLAALLDPVHVAHTPELERTRLKLA